MTRTCTKPCRISPEEELLFRFVSLLVGMPLSQEEFVLQSAGGTLMPEFVIHPSPVLLEHRRKRDAPVHTLAAVSDLKHKINAGVKSAGGQVTARFEDEPGFLSGETSDETTVNVTLTQVRSRRIVWQPIVGVLVIVFVCRMHCNVNAFLLSGCGEVNMQQEASLNIVSAAGQT